MSYAASVDGVGVVIEVNAETDFVAKNDKFVNFVKGVAATVAKENPADLDALMECKYVDTDMTVTQQQQEMVLVIGENIKVRRFVRFADGVSVPYVHGGDFAADTADDDGIRPVGQMVIQQLSQRHQVNGIINKWRYNFNARPCKDWILHRKSPSFIE